MNMMWTSATLGTMHSTKIGDSYQYAVMTQPQEYYRNPASKQIASLVSEKHEMTFVTAC